MNREFVIVFSLLGLSLISGISAQILQNGLCDDNIELQLNFEPEQFLEDWYEVRSTSISNCASLNVNSVNGTYVFTFNAVTRNFPDNSVAEGTLQSGTAQYSLNFGERTEDYWILGTGYTNWAITYRCENVGTNQRNVHVKLLSRSTTIGNILINVINTQLNKVGLTIDDLREVDHTDGACYILPEVPSGQPVVLPGACEANIRQAQNFDASRFLGLWHESYSYYSDNALGTCSRAEYSLGANGAVNVLNSEVVNRELLTISGSAVLGSDDDAKLIVTLEVFPGVFVERELWIIDTDYDTYAISYSCQNSGDNRQVNSWILSRTRFMSESVLADVTAVVDTVLDLNFAYYQQSDQSNDGCFFYPEAAPDRIVEYRGSCNMDIPAVAGFRPEEYMGVWYDIESYPSGFQEGTCNTAQYSLDNDLGVVNVFNTQVINQALDTMTGVGVVASTDGTAKLEVTFPIAGTNATVTTNYWVLATNYDSYSLVYTCSYDESTDMRRVWSWKLSRQRSLSAEARLAIDNAMATVPELDQRYHIVRDFSETGCFYFPEPNSQPVLFPGTCDSTITPVQNFNLNDFSGQWYEVEAYPKQVSRSCYRYEGIVGTGNVLDVNIVSVLNNIGQTSTQTLTLSGTDGRFVTTVDVFGIGNPIEVPVWILATDYNDYAFAYSCFQSSEHFRYVSAWKLSRTQQPLSAAANTAINNVASNIQVIDDRYFEQADLSESVCTILPTIPAGEPIILEGQCDPNVAVVQNFQPGQYVGTWHLIESYPTEFQDGDCNDATYTAQADGSVLVYNTQVINQRLDTITGRAVVASTDGSAKLDVTFPDAPSSVPYWVIATDYDSYSLVYSCVNLTPNTRRVWSWKLSRTKSLTPEAIAAIDRAMEPVTVLNQQYFYTVNNADSACFYYPEADGNPVSFRGTCDNNIPVVINFDAVAYMGRWFDIESYPQFFQEGTCATAEYDLDLATLVVDVFNTQVVNQTLDTINGMATLVDPASTEAKLTVNFPVAGTNLTIDSPYWVLATDYDNYALVYACQNSNDGRRFVSSWKLSRERTLSATSIAAINSVIASVDVLNQEYYEVKGHTDEDCFYFPEPIEGPAVFRGPCDNDIQAVPNFNLANFAGVWNEIETYPKDQAGGDCINHEFTVASDTTLSLTSNQVFNSEDLITNQGQITRSSTDGSGRFTLTMNVNGTNIEIPYWILATDYNDYALVYSCMERVEGGFPSRAVYSWKLSRTNQLSDTARNAINVAMEQVEVLRQEYFEPVSQTEESCFYIPDLGTSEPAIFPGSCDANLPVVTNFDFNRFDGTWFDIESYFDEYQGTCIDGTFTQTGNNNFDAVFTQVVNQQLDTTASNGTLAADNSGKLIVNTNGVQFEFWILGTDYANWALVYSCQNVGTNQRRVRSWKMSRSRTLSNNANNAINEIVSNTNVLTERFFNVRDHSAEGCFYFPEPNGQPVKFRGSCDETINVVQQFDVAAYLGHWYDIQSYPQAFQDGTCSSALYTLGDMGVDVFNTQVLNQRLDIQEGIAVVASDDGSAKLNVTFVVNGITVTTPYWVLDTDYTSYSLVYSCRPDFQDDEYVQVSSWKLSRGRTLSNEANTAINNVIATIDVLRQDYYEIQGHTDEDCFYFPEPNDEPVVFRGPCENNIEAVPNFNLTEFAGVWSEIETYPKDQAGGDCINHEFTFASDTTLSLTSNQVFNSEDLITNQGQITRSSTDGSGRFTLTMNVNGTNIQIPYWVLATDYRDYALVYSCMERIEGAFTSRAVYSWKLSRDNQLSDTARNAINDAMEQVEVLRQEYFEPVSQTEESCFYIPDLGTSEPAIFPGSCDANLPVVTNFDFNRFDGTWFDIESYFDEYQGTCIDGTFTRTGNNNFDAVFTQVVNQRLDTTESSGTLAADNSGKLIINTNGVQFEYWILGTDYANWALVYSCQNVGTNQRRVRSWKMSRSRTLSNNANNAINEIVSNTNVLTERFFNVRDHSAEGCFYFPEPNGQPVKFRASCDETINVVQQFDVAAYLGQWYDIQSYPQDFQDGTCSAALYELGESGVDVFNTQVVNQRLDTMNGTAVVASDDGSAKLDVTFVVNGITFTTPYWVLATDYSSYSLVYSCRPDYFDDEYVQVSSWKLSRTKTLTNEANAAMDNVINNIPVLREEYYEDMGQSEEDCFFYPENYGGPVILNGQCPGRTEAGAITNFNANSFSGTWHEIARFPSELQTGACASSQYTTAGQNAFTINKNIVNNERLVTSTGSGTVDAEGLGIISAALAGDQFDTNMDIYILDTDYSEYALAYGCRNIGNDTKQIYSWQLSRSREGLSQTAQARINDIVNNNVDLYEGYYEPTEQTNNACFYYPRFETLPDSIELPGPCDTRIRGQANFNAAAYLGRWFETARYPQPSQAGSCNRALYSLEGDGPVIVDNTQVVNRVLQRQLGTAVVASTDETGQLEVTFVVDGETNLANYYILATDYTSYSLVYSCRNTDDGNRIVASWKLSRERTLSTAANQAMDRVIADTQGLAEEYYTTTGQSDTDCFYIPEADVQNPVLFKGSCEDFTGMANFDINRFSGLWHEIERYPSGNDDGECTSSLYEERNSQLVVDDKTVFGLSAQIFTNRVEATNDGRLIRRRTEGVAEGVSTWWVLDTDYDSYALVYYCLDNPIQGDFTTENYRIVWSAKHSRTRALTEEAKEAMARVIDENDLLNEDFYVPVDHSDSACFYYPPPTENPVSLPGQCYDNIPLMSNFNLAEYTGTWYQIERYPQFHETGNCTGARYTLDEDTGVVAVTNWQVIDGELDVIEGNATAVTAGEAKFLVTLPSRNEGETGTVQFELNVLDTDYTTYALVYSCVNVGDRRRIGAWKLSRTRTLTPAANTAITNYMANREELDQRYFIEVGQDEDCEEPSAGFLVQSSIIAILVCSILQLIL